VVAAAGRGANSGGTGERARVHGELPRA
jgi:hypothetical protein